MQAPGPPLPTPGRAGVMAPTWAPSLPSLTGPNPAGAAGPEGSRPHRAGGTARTGGEQSPRGPGGTSGAARGGERAERGEEAPGRAGPHLAQRDPIAALMATRPRRAGATAPPAPERLRGAAPAPTPALAPGPAPAGSATGSAMAEPLRPFRLRGCGGPQKFGVAAGSLRGLLRKGCRLLQVRGGAGTAGLRMVRGAWRAAGC